ncbi:MAG: Rpn family recombination-promoting nuclease/putative transposase [Leptospiraceae bacterium]|nr:Rpn family recombination-promoting nuclease/putative transposase [Leptospiraceae bacterium]MCP5497170.1 Rpn family recombination-promoting nuclease/putative transposase [Leptospiraceae bacterium]
MENKNIVVRFDWAMKYILRDKANFDILEGFLSALLEETITILTILESESNQEEETDKFNRVDLLVEDSQKRKIIIEIQNNREMHYLERLLYGTSKVIVENIGLGSSYKEVVKVLSVSIVYFDLGRGDDYIYYGSTEFIGIHNKKPLIVKEKHQNTKVFEPRYEFREKNVFPEYYLIRVGEFENVIQSPIDEWIYMIKNGEVREDFQSKNIDKAREKLRIMNMSQEERRRYDKYLVNVESEQDMVETARQEGEEKGIEKGRELERQQTEKEKNRAEKAEQEKEQLKSQLDSSIKKALERGKLSLEEIAEDFGVSVDYIKQI